MAKSRSSSGIPQGTAFEYRVARLRFCQGYFIRRSIDVWPAELEGDKLAELDCLAVVFDPQLRRFLEIVECKTGGRGEGEIDRLIWLKGLSDLAQARSVTFAKLALAPRTRNFARRLGVDVLDEATIGTAERDLRVPADWWPGFHDPEFGESVVKPARTLLNASRELRKAGKFLFGSFWFTDDFSRIKQLRTLFQLLTEYRSILPREALILGIGEGTTLFMLTVLSIAAWTNQLADTDFRQLTVEELSTGLGDPRGLRNLLRRVDELQRDQIEALHASYQRTGVGRLPFVTQSLETTVLTPPEWVDAFLDLVLRFAKRPHLATNIVRWTDLWAAELLGAQGSRNSDLAYPFFGEQERNLQNALDLVLTFLTRVWGVPQELIAVSSEFQVDDGDNQPPLHSERDAVSWTETNDLSQDH